MTPTPPRAVEPPPPPAPRPWPVALAGLLSRLEHDRAGLAGRRLAADGNWLLDKAEAMVQAAEDLARETEFPAKAAPAEAEAVARAGMVVAAVRAVRGGPRAPGFRFALAAVTGDGSPAAPPAAVRGCLAAAGDALHVYFRLFTERYPTSAAARNWVDAATAFLTEYREAVRRLAES